MEVARTSEHLTDPTPHFPWGHVLITALMVLAVVGLIMIIRRGGGTALVAAAPVAALSAVRANRPRPKALAREPIDMEFLKELLRQGADDRAIVTPTELKVILNNLFEQRNMRPPFESEQHMAKILSSSGLRSKVRSVPGRSERRWYDFSNYGTHETPAQ